MGAADSFVKEIQELLDLGYSHTKIGRILGFDHKQIARTVSEFSLESYVPFDEHAVVIEYSSLYDWAMEEDWLEKIYYEAFDNVAFIHRTKDFESIRVGKYVREKYGSLLNYFLEKDGEFLLDNMFLSCSCCGKILSLENFCEDKQRLWGMYGKCRKCHREITNEWASNNPDKIFENNQKRREMAEVLPFIFTSEDWIVVREKTVGKCSVSCNNRNISIDHFIPIAIGHGGTFIENLIPLNRNLNSSKGSQNPFEWAKSKQINIQRLVLQLSYSNCLTPTEYEAFVNWCFANTRSIDEVIVDRRHSIEIWREASGVHFPLPKYALSEIGNCLTDDKSRKDDATCPSKIA